MGKFDSRTDSNRLGGVLVLLLIVMLISTGMGLMQNIRVGELEKKLEMIEPIIDDYCITHPQNLDFCGEILEGYDEVDPNNVLPKLNP